MFKLLLSFTFIAVALAAPRVGLFSKPGSKIVGGEEASITDFPYQVSFRYYGEHMCGGSILSKDRILTAAHCTDGLRASQMSIMVGSDNIEKGQIIDVAGFSQHPMYDENTVDYDMSILILTESLTFSDKVQPIALQNQGEEVEPGTGAVISGWGATFEGDEETPITLLKTNVEVISDENCKTAYSAKRITKRMMCAQHEGRDSCQGDSGGPLASNGKLIGVVSWGVGCARPKYPGVYAKVSSELKRWIDIHV